MTRLYMIHDHFSRGCPKLLHLSRLSMNLDLPKVEALVTQHVLGKSQHRCGHDAAPL